MEDRMNMELTENTHFSEPQEIRYWSEKLNVPQEVLKNAVRAAETSEEDFIEHPEKIAE